MGINGGTGIVGSGSVLGGSGISLPKGGGGGTPPFSFGNALQFDGVNDYVTHSNIAIGAAANFTISFWFYNSNASWNNTIFGKSNNNSFAFRLLSTTSFRLWVRDFTVPSMSLNTWYHCTIIGSAAGIRLYLNGSESSSGLLATLSAINIDQIGKYFTSAPAYIFNGKLDEIAIWNGTTGTAQNAIDLYNGGDGALASDIIASPTAYWRMNGVAGDSTAIDEQGTYNGTLTNFDTDTCWVAH